MKSSMAYKNSKNLQVRRSNNQNSKATTNNNNNNHHSKKDPAHETVTDVKERWSLRSSNASTTAVERLKHLRRSGKDVEPRPEWTTPGAHSVVYTSTTSAIAATTRSNASSSVEGEGETLHDDLHVHHPAAAAAAASHNNNITVVFPQGSAHMIEAKAVDEHQEAKIQALLNTPLVEGQQVTRSMMKLQDYAETASPYAKYLLPISITCTCLSVTGMIVMALMIVLGGVGTATVVDQTNANTHNNNPSDAAPTLAPMTPSMVPTVAPSMVPTEAPSVLPTLVPSVRTGPTVSPSEGFIAEPLIPDIMAPTVGAPPIPFEGMPPRPNREWNDDLIDVPPTASAVIEEPIAPSVHPSRMPSMVPTAATMPPVAYPTVRPSSLTKTDPTATNTTTTGNNNNNEDTTSSVSTISITMVILMVAFVAVTGVVAAAMYWYHRRLQQQQQQVVAAATKAQAAAMP